MCIVSFIKLGEKKTVITFNRDEHRDRSFINPGYIWSSEIFCPVDEEAGGTWIGKNQKHVVCLQNGGSECHLRDLPYDKSRGLILKDLLVTDDIEKVLFGLHHKKIEPFTLCVFGIETQRLELFTFNGVNIHREGIELIKPFVNCSSTLYSEEAKNIIKERFMSTFFADEDEIFKFHMEHRIGGSRNSFVGIPGTSSITQFILEKQGNNCVFMDLLKNQRFIYNL